MKNSIKQGYTYIAYRDQVCLILAKRRQALMLERASLPKSFQCPLKSVKKQTKKALNILPSKILGHMPFGLHPCFKIKFLYLLLGTNFIEY